MEKAKSPLFRIVTQLSRIGLGLIFLAAFAAKGIDIVRFGRRIEIVFGTYGVAESEFWIYIALATAGIILIIELIIGSMLLAGFGIRYASAASIVLLLIFITRLFWEISIGSENECGCFGTFIERSAVDALMENLVFLVLAMLALRVEKKRNKKRALAAMGILIAGISWGAYFSANPTDQAAVRSGISWIENVSDEKESRTKDGLFWLFDPDCHECQAELEYISNLAGKTDSPELVGITTANPGKIQEFIWDFEVKFKIERISKQREKQIYLPVGSLILILDGQVKRIWRPKSLQNVEDEITKLIRS